jgi:hemoglobin-like flavoprotein
MRVDPMTLGVFEPSLARCLAAPRFLDRFYERFLASSPKVREKFAGTDFDRQKQALAASFQTLLAAAREVSPQDEHMRSLAERHSSRDLKIGAELYDNWLDSLLETVLHY